MVSAPLLLRAALAALVAGGLSVPAAAAEPLPRRDSELVTVPDTYDAPLLVTIDTLTPGEVPSSGPVEVTGSVINRDVESWSGIRLYPFLNAGSDCFGCPPPITTEAGLVDAAETPPEDVVGNRITEVGFTIDELSPGEVAFYRIRIPRRLLEVSTPGVYWFGVHALGASDSTADDDVADGRARTFLPYLPRGRDGVRGRIDTSVVIPLRYRIRHLANGQLAHRDEWETAFDQTGDLGAPLAFGAAAVGKPVTWLVDPAVLDAARRLRRGNPPRDLGPEEDDSDSDGPSPSDEPTDNPDDENATVEDDPVADAAADWLDSLELQLRGEEVLTLPYGDLDMSATPDRAPDLYPLARERQGEVLTAWNIRTAPVIGSPGGYLDPSAMPDLADESLLLLTDRMFAGDGFPRGAPVVGEYDGHRIAATSYGAATGGPGPEPRLGAVGFRQRVLAEAAVRLLAPGRRHPLVVVVPRSVDGADGETFWSGLEADWVNLTTIEDATDRPTTEVDPEALDYPLDQETAELSTSAFTAAEDLIAAGDTLANLLTDADRLGSDVRGEALTGTSYHFRNDSLVAASRLARSRRWIERKLRAVTIEGPRSVTLSSADGSFAVEVNNDLDRTVTVHIAGESIGDEVRIEVADNPSGDVVLAANSRTTVLLDAHTRSTGVHNVTLAVTDADGTPLGSTVEVPIRSGQVSQVIWLILGSGVGILFVAIGLRIFRRFRNGATGSTAEDPA